MDKAEELAADIMAVKVMLQESQASHSDEIKALQSNFMEIATKLEGFESISDQVKELMENKD